MSSTLLLAAWAAALLIGLAALERALAPLAAPYRCSGALRLKDTDLARHDLRERVVGRLFGLWIFGVTGAFLWVFPHGDTEGGIFMGAMPAAVLAALAGIFGASKCGLSGCSLAASSAAKMLGATVFCLLSAAGLSKPVVVEPPYVPHFPARRPRVLYEAEPAPNWSPPSAAPATKAPPEEDDPC